MEASWRQSSPWRAWGEIERDAHVDAIAEQLVEALNLNERDLMLVGKASVTLLWWLWDQPVYIQITGRRGDVLIRAGCSVLAFSELSAAQFWALRHNETTTFWSWYADTHEDVPSAGVVRSFLKLRVGSGASREDLQFAVAVLKDFAADMLLKHYNSVSGFTEQDASDLLVAFTPMRHPSQPTLTPDRDRTLTVGEHRVAIAEYGNTHANGFAGNVTADALRGVKAALEHAAEVRQPDGNEVVILGSPLGFWASSLCIVTLRTDIVNPAMGAGLLVHVAIPYDVHEVTDLAALVSEEMRQLDACTNVGAWSTDPLDLWDKAMALPAASLGEPSRRASHTAFYPAYYVEIRSVRSICDDLGLRLRGSR